MTASIMPGATLWVLTINTIALIGFACAPVAQEYPLAVVGILAFLFVQAFLPACRIHVAAPLCPANIAQGYYWIQLVLVTVLVGYFGFSHGTLPYLPSKDAINLAIVVHVVGYLSFSVAYQCFGRAIVGRTQRHESTPGAAYLIVPFAVLGLLGFLLMHGGVAGFIEYASSPTEHRLRADEATTLQGAAGNFLKHFLGFAVVLAWSWWLGRAPRRKVSIIAVTAAVVIVLLIATFNYNRGSMLGPIVGLAAAFSAHVWRIPFKGVILAGVLALSIAFAFGWYRSTDLDITELSVSAVADTWDSEGVVEFVQIYASGPQMSAYLIESLEGKFYYGETLFPSLVYPIPVLGKPYRDISGPVIFNELIYGDHGMIIRSDHSPGRRALHELPPRRGGSRQCVARWSSRLAAGQVHGRPEPRGKLRLAHDGAVDRVPWQPVGHQPDIRVFVLADLQLLRGQASLVVEFGDSLPPRPDRGEVFVGEA